MREVGVLEAKTNLSALIESVERGGEEIVITRHGKPVARLSAAPEAAIGQVRRLSGEELAERFRQLRERLAHGAPELQTLSWDDVRDLRDS